MTATFGAATILLLPLLSAGIGRTAVATSAWLLALSPAMVFYSRMFIQESLLAFFTLAFVIAVGRVATGGGLGCGPRLAGVAAGLAIATKETSVIVLPAALAACAIALWSLRSGSPRDALARGRWLRAVLVGIAAAAAVAALFYSSFLTAPRAVLDPFRAAGPYLDRVVAPANHVHPWNFYLGLLTYSSSGGLKWSEGLVLALAIAGAVTARTILGALSRLLRDRRHGHLLVHPLQDSVERSAVLRRDDRARRNRLLYASQGDIVPRGEVCRRRGVPRRVGTSGMAGLARVGDLRVRSAKSLRLRANRSRRRPHGDPDPRAGGPAP